jgi:hypothetical protein
MEAAWVVRLAVEASHREGFFESWVNAVWDKGGLQTDALPLRCRSHGRNTVSGTDERMMPKKA